MSKYKGIFITGTNTEVGKTFIGNFLLEYLLKKNINVFPYKPIESGIKAIENSDCYRYWLLVKEKFPIKDICPYPLRFPISPVLAAKRENKKIFLKDILEPLKSKKSFFILTEGAGGFYSPLTSDGLVADFAQKLNLPVIIVIKDELGCINHTLLTIEAVKRRNLKILCLIINFYDENKPTDNLNDLKSLTKYPIIPISTNPVKDKVFKLFESFFNKQKDLFI